MNVPANTADTWHTTSPSAIDYPGHVRLEVKTRFGLTVWHAQTVRHVYQSSGPIPWRSIPGPHVQRPHAKRPDMDHRPGPTPHDDYRLAHFAGELLGRLQRNYRDRPVAISLTFDNHNTAIYTLRWRSAGHLCHLAHYIDAGDFRHQPTAATATEIAEVWDCDLSIRQPDEA